MHQLMNPIRRARENNVDAWIPELWAQAGLLQLRENMVVQRLVNTDFSSTLAQFGDIVNTRRPQEFKAKRKHRSTNVAIQDAIGDNVAIPLNQHIYNSFLIHDVDSAKSFQELHDEFLVPSMRALAREVDLILMAQWIRFRRNGAGDLATAASKAGVIAVDERFNVNKAPPQGRNLIINPATNSTLLNLPEFSEVDKTGDTAGLRDASLGRKFNQQIWMAQNTPTVSAAYQPAAAVGAINNGAGYPVGSTVLTVDGFTGDDAPIGSYVTIAGDDRPLQVTARTLTSAAVTSITVEALQSAVLDDAVITAYTPTALVNQAVAPTGYAVDHGEAIVYDAAGAGKAPQIGQLISFGNVSGQAEYGIIDVTDNGDGTGEIWLDRPLEAAVANNAPLNLGPSGSFNLGLLRDAMTFVMRPLGAPRGGGANAATASDPDLQSTVRVVFAYDHLQQATVVTADFLCGVQLLDVNLGAVFYTNDSL
jgi:hypothetical protein